MSASVLHLTTVENSSLVSIRLILSCQFRFCATFGSPAFRPERGDERGERIGQTTHFGFLFNSPRIRFATFSLRYLWWRRKPAATFLALRPRNRGFKLVRYQQIRAITITICHAFRWPTTFCIFGLRARVVVPERNRVQSEKIPGEIDT